MRASTEESTKKTGPGSIGGPSNRKRMSMSDVSDMLYEFYRANVAAKAPKNQQQTTPDKSGQTSPTSAETHEPSTIAAIAMSGASTAGTDIEAILKASKNLKGDEMSTEAAPMAFHQRIKYTNKSAGEGVNIGLVTLDPQTENDKASPLIMTAIPTSVVVPPKGAIATHCSPQFDIKPIVNPATGEIVSPSAAAASVIKPVPGVNTNLKGSDGTSASADITGVVPDAAVIAAALLRGNMHNIHSLQQQIRAHEILKHHRSGVSSGPRKREREQLTAAITTATTPTKILENFLRQQRDHRNSECENDPHGLASDTNDGDDEEDDSRYNGFDDIHLMEGGVNANTKNAYGGSMPNIYQTSGANASAVGAEYLSDESQKYMLAHAQAFRNLEFAFGDMAAHEGVSPGGSRNISPTVGADGEPTYECRHCGKKYRWKSTLRRHENVECGGKEPSHQCPYCPYKSKQRGNLGVHVRKHHSHLPQLASKRRSKYCTKLEGGGGGNTSDDSSSRLVIDCSK